MIQIKNICFKYHNSNTIFENLNLTIKNNDKITITGNSGTGKSTLVNLILGFEIPQKGIILFDNTKLNTANVQNIRQKTAWLPQNFNIPFDTVEQLFYYIFSLKINNKLKPNKKQIENIFNKLELDLKLMKNNIDEISGGQKQRILLSAIILLKRPYIILDEPTSALDNNAVENVANIIFGQKNTTVITISHNNTLINKANTIINLNKIATAS